MHRIVLITALALASCMLNAHAAVTSADICQSAQFQAAPVVALGRSPLTVRSLVNGTQVCFEFALASTAPSGTTWFAVGISPSGDMVNSPSKNVMVYQSAVGKPESYVIGGYSTSGVAIESDQSFFTVDSTNTASMSYRYQRTLAASSSSDVVIDPTKVLTFIWAHGTSWPISSHKTGTKGTATYAVNTGGASGSTAVAASTVTSPFCKDKNCAAIIGGITFAVMLLGGFLVAGVLRNTALGHALLHKTLATPSVKLTTNSLIGAPHTLFLQNIADLKVGETCIILLFFAAIATLATLVHEYEQDATVITGQVTVLVIMFLLLPIARIPLWTVVYGSSFERIVKFHRWIGMSLSIVTVLHLIYALKKKVNVLSTDKMGEVTPLYGFIAFVSFGLVLLTANEVVRRSYFEVFYYSHRVFSLVGLIGAILHSPKYIGLALAVPLAFYAMSMIHGWLQAYTTTYRATTSVHEGTNVTTLLLQPTAKTKAFAQTMELCSYFWIKIPTVSGFEWHPFSAIASPAGDTIGFSIRAMGRSNNTFTSKLLTAASKTHELNLRMLGPFGKIALDVDAYEVILLVGGGVGITPLLSAINQRSRGVTKAAKAAQWNILWSVRHPNDLLMAEKLMPTAGRSGAAIGSVQDSAVPVLGGLGSGSFTVAWSCHCSMANQDGSVTREGGEMINYRAGVPVLEEYINTSRYMNRKVGVLACGPPTMVVEAQALAQQCGFDFHKEVFNW